MPDETVDLPERVAALEQRVTRVEAMTDVVTAIRADMATIAEGVDPRLTEHVAELDDRVETLASDRPLAGGHADGPTTRKRVAGPSSAPAAPRPTGRGRSRARPPDETS
jgi:hypothetical protein